jgi:hypothetical protein
MHFSNVVGQFFFFTSNAALNKLETGKSGKGMYCGMRKEKEVGMFFACAWICIKE